MKTYPAGEMEVTVGDKLFKRHERETAAEFGGVRVPVSGRGDGPDVAHSWLSIECKSRARLADYVHKGMAQAVRAATGEQLPIVVLHEKGKRYDDDYVVLRRSDFVDWWGDFLYDPEAA